MALRFLLEAPIALIPVLVFFAVLLHLDSYRLVSFREVLGTLSAGALLCAASYFVNAGAMSALKMDFATYSGYVAPFVEESLKASALIWLFARNRIGFMIDATIMGFSVGAGFALVENIYLLYALPNASLGVWIVRGFGTAIMHSGATALFAALVQSIIEKRLKPMALLCLAALSAAAALHAVFNAFESTPLVATAILLVVLPPAFMLVFSKSKHAVHKWLLSDYESHEHLLEKIRTGEFELSEAGQLIVNLTRKFPPHVAADIFAYLQIYTELILRAERTSLARETGEKIHVAAEDEERFKRLRALERKIGHTARMTVWPHLHFSRRELWELHELKGELWRV